MKTAMFIFFSLALCHSAFGEIKSETVSLPMRDGVKLRKWLPSS